MRLPSHRMVPWTAVMRPARAHVPPPHASTCHRPILTSSTSSPRARSRRAFHPTPANLPRRRDFFTSNAYLQQKGGPPSADEPRSPPSSAPPHHMKRKQRGGDVKKSLRRVAIIAQQQPQPGGHRAPQPPDESPALISAACVAESFSMSTVRGLLAAAGYDLDPDGTGFEAAEVVHARRPEMAANGGDGDVFVFPSGTVVAWAVPVEDVVECLLDAAEDPHALARREFEDLEYVLEPDRDASTIKGDLVVLGTRRASAEGGDRLDTTLAKVAFSSGLARSTKLAVLETDLDSYFEQTRSIPSLLSQGSRLRLSRTFIHQKTGELLSLSARLNNYSELTDSLPDIFWDSRADLGLEGYYDQVGRALDVNVRIRTLNQRLDYAQDIASVLREMSGERHSTRLEVIIILLIAVEVVFELRREWKEYHANKRAKEEADGVAG